MGEYSNFLDHKRPTRPPRVIRQGIWEGIAIFWIINDPPGLQRLIKVTDPNCVPEWYPTKEVRDQAHKITIP